VLPGSTETELMWIGVGADEIPEERRKVEAATPLGKLADPEEIAQAVLWLCSPLASFASGSLISVDGGVSSRAPSPR
jgi:NAD(P)-dependent dehydrogenase (short-subunit alcohol dehydrogenase family)